MSTLGNKSEAFDLSRDGEMIVIAKRREHVVDGIVTGIIANLIMLPLLSVALIVGVWALVLTVTRERSLFLGLVGLIFAGGSLFLLRFFLKTQASFFPYECRLKKDAEGGWTVQQRLWFVSFRWRKLGHDWAISCYPNYSRGDWGYAFFIHSGGAMLRLASSGFFTGSKKQAEVEALKDLGALKGLFAVSGEMKRWN